MLKKEIEICGKKVPFRSSATIPRLYRAKFKRDIFKDLSRLEKSYKGKTEDGDEFQIEDLEIFENVAYIMAYHADNNLWVQIGTGYTMDGFRRAVRAAMDRNRKPGKKNWYRVRRTWADASSEKGAFQDPANGKKCADGRPGYSVFDESGKALYKGKSCRK